MVPRNMATIITDLNGDLDQRNETPGGAGGGRNQAPPPRGYPYYKQSSWWAGGASALGFDHRRRDHR